jgi:hypothetical protein
MADAQHALPGARASDHHGPPKVNFWEDPKSPANWKAEQVRGSACKRKDAGQALNASRAAPHARAAQTVLIILGCWAVTIKSALTYFGK